MPTITPHLWFDKQAREAAEFYCSVFPNSRITGSTVLPDTPSGDSEVVTFSLWGQDFNAISAGPIFTFTPAISFIVNIGPRTLNGENPREMIDSIWEALSDGGTVLMPIDKYFFSERYGWIQDKYGLSWQLAIQRDDEEGRPAIQPTLLFGGDKAGKANAALDFYTSLFDGSARGATNFYTPEMQPDSDGMLAFADFHLGDQWFAAMDSSRSKDDFNEAVSLMVHCDDQDEIDAFWEKLSAVPEAEQCGWLKDKFGVSWQIVPQEFEEMMRTGTPEQIKRIVQTFLPMKKLEIEPLRQAFNSNS